VPSAGASLLVGSPPNFPPVLTRYTLEPSDILLSYLGPS
jgi:hypothetical protein